MAQNASNVRVAVAGAVHVAPLGTTLPSTFDEPLDAAFEEVGFITEDGITETYEVETEDLIAWQGATIVRKVNTSSNYTFEFSVMETTRVGLELFFGGSYVEDDGVDGYKLDVKSGQRDQRVFVFDVLDGDEHIRIACAQAEVVERGEITYASGEAISYPMTVTAYPVNGTVMTRLSGSAAWAPAAGSGS